MIQKLNIKAICHVAQKHVSKSDIEVERALSNYYKGEVLNKKELQSIIDFLNNREKTSSLIV